MSPAPERLAVAPETQLEIVNATIPHAALGASRRIRLTDASIALVETGLDSLDRAVIGVYLCELFDVPLDQQKEMPTDHLQEMFAFLRRHGRREVQGGADVERMLAASP